MLGGWECSGRRGALEAGADAGWRVLGHGVGGRGMLGALGGRIGVGVGRWLERAGWGECWVLWSGGIDLRWK